MQILNELKAFSLKCFWNTSLPAGEKEKNNWNKTPGAVVSGNLSIVFSFNCLDGNTRPQGKGGKKQQQGGDASKIIL